MHAKSILFTVILALMTLGVPETADAKHRYRRGYYRSYPQYYHRHYYPRYYYRSYPRYYYHDPYYYGRGYYYPRYHRGSQFYLQYGPLTLRGGRW